MGLVQTVAHLFHPRRSNNHRPRLLQPESLTALVVIAALFSGLVYATTSLPGTSGRVLGYASSITPTQVIQLTNAERQKEGLSPLTVNAELSAAAVAKGNHMFANQYWAHIAPDGTQPWYFFKQAGYNYQLAGENLARDFSDSPTMMSAWMASPTHRANIMNGRYQEIGIGVVDGTLNGYETTIVVQLFGTPRTTAQVPAVTTVAAVSESAPASPVLKPTPSPKATNIPEITDSLTETTQPAASPVVTPTSAEPPTSQVLASSLVPTGSLAVPPLFTPLQLIKAFFLGLIMMIGLTLIYDSTVIGHRSALRLVGKNLAHLLLLGFVAFLLILFKGGIVG